MNEDESEERTHPEPAKLREGETPDISSHTQRNLEQIRQAEDEGWLPEGRADKREEEMREGAEE